MSINYFRNIFFNLIGYNDIIKKEAPEPDNIILVNKMFDNIPQLYKLTVKDIMIPRIDVKYVNTSISLNELLDTISKYGHSRILVSSKDSIDNIKGILHVKDLFTYFRTDKANKEFNISHFLRKAYFIPSSKPILDLLKQFQVTKNHMALIVDEYGGLLGIVTLEDILEEIVGEIQDEYDPEVKDLILKVSDNIYLVDAILPISAFNKQFNITDNVDVDTLGGLIFEIVGKIPKVKDIISYKDMKLEIISMSGNRIVKVKVHI